METRGNFFLIGLFTIMGVIGIVAMFLWFARVELDRQFDYYDIRFTSVSGLSEASDVRFAGLPVGQVVDVSLSPERDGTVLVRVEVSAETPVRADSIATIEAQGVTGVSFVGISPGRPDTPLLDSMSDDDIPFIQAGRSVFQSLSEEAPLLISETIEAVQEINILLGGANRDRFQNILENVEISSETLVTTLDDFSSAAASAAEFGTQVAAFNSILEQLADDLESLLQSADTTIASYGALSDEAQTALIEGTEALVAAQSAISAVEAFVTQDLTTATADVQSSATTVEREVAALSQSAQSVFSIFEETGTLANARLREAEVTLDIADAAIQDFNIAMLQVDQTTTFIDDWLREDGQPFLDEARIAFQQATEVIGVVGAAAERDLPVVIENVRAATESARLLIDTVGVDLSSASGQISTLTVSAEETLRQVTETFANANSTISAVNSALAVGERTLDAATRVFEGTDALINDQVDGLVSRLEANLDTLNDTVALVAGDLPGITSELRAASATAAEAFVELQAIINAAGGPVTEFATGGLPSITSLASETRILISNLDRLIQQISRDPARFLLDQQSPEFQR